MRTRRTGVTGVVSWRECVGDLGVITAWLPDSSDDDIQCFELLWPGPAPNTTRQHTLSLCLTAVHTCGLDSSGAHTCRTLKTHQRRPSKSHLLPLQRVSITIVSLQVRLQPALMRAAVPHNSPACFPLPSSGSSCELDP